ncbi:hypothetical protein AS888_03520 [Peribacillus simplex]|uniref:Uncharacterized protein n=1 Tax=Peribacillus simplex TaxID=1478 RepID=A0A109N384_9BACI|nr:hypothetical protein AS888_03520 [Peribacillus simplex]
MVHWLSCYIQFLILKKLNAALLDRTKDRHHEFLKRKQNKKMPSNYKGFFKKIENEQMIKRVTRNTLLHYAFLMKTHSS